MSTDSATVLTFQPFSVTTKGCSLYKFWRVITQLHENTFNLDFKRKNPFQHKQIMDLEWKPPAY
jgi:hypothetical protein